MTDRLPCPHCGELIPADSVCCRHCGSDAETGWSGDVEYTSIELPEPDDDLHYARYSRRRRNLRIVGLIALLGFTGLLWPVLPSSTAGKILRIVLAFACTLWVLSLFRSEPAE